MKSAAFLGDASANLSRRYIHAAPWELMPARNSSSEMDASCNGGEAGWRIALAVRWCAAVKQRPLAAGMH